MSIAELDPFELKVFLNHIYELKKGVRRMALYTTSRKYQNFTTQRLRSQHIPYHIQEVDDDRINIYFGDKACIKAVRLMIDRPLYELSPEEDFILGAMLGYDISGQCERYCTRKSKKKMLSVVG